MRYLSLCSGIEAASVAWSPLGWTPVAFAEVDPFCCKLLAHRFPGIPNLGDITAPDFVDRALALGPIDLVVGGTPCQAFSVAGLRRGLADDRSNLALRFVEIVHGINPAWALWENVPGALTIEDNAFGCLLGGLLGSDTAVDPGRFGWTDAGMALGPARDACWRTLDAQHFGLAQRRRRLFVASRRARDGAGGAAVLLEPEGVRRHLAPSREEGKGAPASTPATADDGVARCLTTRGGG